MFGRKTRKTNRPYGAGDRVRITNRQAASFLAAGGLKTTGKIEKILNPLTDSVQRNRIYVVKLDSGQTDEFARSEIQRI